MARRVSPTSFEPVEALLSAQGYSAVAGVDEVGRGCLAGPVVAAAVILGPGFDLSGINDSKKLSAEQREIASARILDQALAVGIGAASVDEIAELNILWASLLAMKRAIAQLPVPADYLLIDGNRGLDLPIPQQTLVKGDSRSASIAAASVVAKVHRDTGMVDLGKCFPEYGFKDHKGYGTASHRDAIATLGPCPHHRRTFRGVVEHWPADPRDLRNAAEVGEQMSLFGSARGHHD